MKACLSLLTLAVLLLGLTACDVEEFNEARNALEEMGESISQMNEQREQTENGSTAREPVDFRSLRDLLPERAASLERIDMEGERQGMMGMSVSRAQATYSGGGSTISLSIMDIGGVAGFQMLGFGWARTEIDRETSSGYERTGSFEGHRSREEYNSDRQQGSLQVLVARRFVVEAEGNNVSMDDLHDTVSELDLTNLERLAAEQREEEQEAS